MGKNSMDKTDKQMYVSLYKKFSNLGFAINVLQKASPEIELKNIIEFCTNWLSRIEELNDG